ncbi:unnamed protein product [Orchesella dallaii]|uniref:Odorant receptor n=1 Tax=Orchesella dallaii TaxID=48710 RepID=A0ABP1S7I9_9HEXA
MEQNLEKFLKFYQSIGSFPYRLTFIPDSHGFSINFNRKSFWIWAISLTAGLFHWGRTVITLVDFAPEYLKRKEYVNIVCHIMWSVGFGGSLCQNFPVVCRSDEVMQLGNGTLRSMSYIEKAFSKPDLFRRAHLTKYRILTVFCGISILVILFDMVAFIYFREQVFHYGSDYYHLMKVLMSGHTVVPLMFGIFAESQFLAAVYGILIIEMYISIQFIQTFKVTLQFLRRKAYKSQQKELQQKFLIYQQLRVLNILYNNSFGSHYIPYISSATGFGIVQGIFMTVRMAYMANVIITGLGILCFLICSFILVIITTIAGTINEQSLMFVRHVKGKGYRGCLGRRIIRAFKIVSVKSGNLYERALEGKDARSKRFLLASLFSPDVTSFLLEFAVLNFPI